MGILLGPSAKWVAEILLHKQLEKEFFRPKRLEFDARPFVYNSLGSVKKVGANWELENNGADELKRATVPLDSHFKLLIENAPEHRANAQPVLKCPLPIKL